MTDKMTSCIRVININNQQLTRYKIIRRFEFLAAYPSLERNRFSNWSNLSLSVLFMRISISDITSLISSLIRCSSLF